MLKKACWLLLFCFPVTSLAGAGVGLGMDHGQFQPDSMQMVENHDSVCPHTKAAIVKNSGQHHAANNTDTPKTGIDFHGSTMCYKSQGGELLLEASPAVAFVAHSVLTYPPNLQAATTSFLSLIERPPRI